VIPTLPLALRNRLAETILAAFHDERARAALAALAAPEAAERWLAGAERRWAWALTERARRAGGALAGRALRPEKRDLGAALEDAAVLFDAGLHSRCTRSSSRTGRGARATRARPCRD
jgi:hypothetical protein